MRSCLIDRCKPYPLVRISLLTLLTLVFCGWTTCTAIIGFNSCPGSVPQPQIASLFPNTISGGADSVLLTVNGNNFVPQSQILWNGKTLQTRFTDSRHLQTIITQQTFDSFGGSAGSSVLISAISPASAFVAGCPDGGTSSTLMLFIN
jgi:hypothetical protein